MFEPNCNPDMMPAIRPYLRESLFGYGELARLCVCVLRKADKPLTLEHIVGRIVDAKGLVVEARVQRLRIVRKPMQNQNAKILFELTDSEREKIQSQKPKTFLEIPKSTQEEIKNTCLSTEFFLSANYLNREPNEKTDEKANLDFALRCRSAFPPDMSD